jgi:hypothetical protein
MVAGACASEGPALSPAQREALETRPVDTPADQALRAAAGVLMDQGMIISLSDAGAGLVAGRSWVGGGMSEVRSPRSRLFSSSILVWVRPLDAGRSEIRVQVTLPGGGGPDERRVSDFVRQVHERTMMWSGTLPPKGPG